MRSFLRFRYQKETYFGILVGDHTAERIEGTPFGFYQGTSQLFSFDEITFLPPSQPTKIVCLGLNYQDHAREVGLAIPDEPVIFIKPPTAVIGHLGEILYPAASARVDYEAELAVVIGKTCRKVAEADALDYVAGFTCLNDVTARDLQQKDGQWTRAKGFDTFCPIGPYLTTDIDPSDLAVEAYLNGERRQSSRTSRLIFPIPFLIRFISDIMTLHPGDVVSTGTPSGIGPMKQGDTIEIHIENVGKLVNFVV